MVPSFANGHSRATTETEGEMTPTVETAAADVLVVFGITGNLGRLGSCLPPRPTD